MKKLLKNSKIGSLKEMIKNADHNSVKCDLQPDLKDLLKVWRKSEKLKMVESQFEKLII